MVDLIDTLHTPHRAGAEIDARDRDERTALHFAAIAGGEEACHALIRRGADPHAQDVDRETPLVRGTAHHHHRPLLYY
jgi:ankyrin repeat protein